MANYQSVRFKPELIEEAAEMGELIGHSPPQFISECVKAICYLANNPDRRDIPRIVRLLDAARQEPTSFVDPSSVGRSSGKVKAGIQAAVKHAKNKAVQPKSVKPARKR